MKYKRSKKYKKRKWIRKPTYISKKKPRKYNKYIKRTGIYKKKFKR